MERFVTRSGTLLFADPDTDLQNIICRSAGNVSDDFCRINVCWLFEKRSWINTTFTCNEPSQEISAFPSLQLPYLQGILPPPRLVDCRGG